MISVESLQALCGDPDRVSVSKPLSVRIGKSWWDVATNGHAMLMVRQGNGEHERDNAPPVADISKHMPAKPTHLVDARKLYDWARDCELWSACEGCKGTKVHKCDCYFCEIVAGDTCPACDGDGGGWAQLPVNFEHVQFNRTLVARYLEPVKDRISELPLFLGAELDPFEIRADDWRLIVMPMRRAPEDKAVKLPAGIIRK